MLVFLLSQIEANSQITLDNLATLVQEKFQIQISVSSIHRALEKMDVTWKNIFPVPVNWNTPEIIRARSDYISKLEITFRGRKRIFLDESGFNLHIKKSRERSLRGRFAILTVLPKGKNISLLAALSEEGIVFSKTRINIGEQKGTTGEDFRSFITDLVAHIPRSSLLILDNAKIHHATLLDTTWTMLKKTFDIDVLYLPPYSPFLNPIEYAFNFLKNEIKSSSFSNRSELLTLINQKIPSIDEEKAQAFFRQTEKYYSQCILGLPFTGNPISPDLNLPEDSSNQPHQPLLSAQ